MKQLLLFSILIVLTNHSYSQSKNYKFSREVVTANQDYSVVTKFTVDHELTDSEITALKENLFAKNTVYSMTTNSKKTEVFVYHLSQVHFEDLKILIQNTNIELNFISTEITEFKNIHVGTIEIER